MIVYEDTDVGPEVFMGEGAEEAARARYEQSLISWSCHLFVNAAQLDAANARVATLTDEIDTLKSAAHMPEDYEFGLPSWINQKLYSAYIGLHFNPEVLEQIRKGQLRFPDSPDARRRAELEEENRRLRLNDPETMLRHEEALTSTSPEPDNSRPLESTGSGVARY